MTLAETHLARLIKTRTKDSKPEDGKKIPKRYILRGSRTFT